MLSKIQGLYEAHQEKVAQTGVSSGCEGDDSEVLVLQLIVLDKSIMSEPATCIADVGILAEIAKYWRDEDDLTTLDGFDYAVAVAAANFIKTE